MIFKVFHGRDWEHQSKTKADIKRPICKQNIETVESFFTFQINLENENNEWYFRFPLFSFIPTQMLLRMIKRFQVDDEADLKDIKL